MFNTSATLGMILSMNLSADFSDTGSNPIIPSIRRELAGYGPYREAFAA